MGPFLRDYGTSGLVHHIANTNTPSPFLLAQSNITKTHVYIPNVCSHCLSPLSVLHKCDFCQNFLDLLFYVYKVENHLNYLLLSTTTAYPIVCLTFLHRLPCSDLSLTIRSCQLLQVVSSKHHHKWSCCCSLPLYCRILQSCSREPKLQMHS